MSYSIIGFKLLKMGSMAIYTMFLLTGGMVLPYIWGLMFLKESFSIMRTAALVLIITGVVLSNFSDDKTKPKQIVMCITVFFLNGFVSVISKLHQIEINYECVNSIEFIILGGIFRFLFAGILYLIFRNKEEYRSERNGFGKVIMIIILSAVVGGTSYLLQLNGAKSLPATVLYPFVTGGGIVFSALMGKVIFKEKLSCKTVLSIILCFVGTVMFL
ncbi:MAG: SMR family transporter [Clostridia bacterium]|nr:SMR family transporter [Clostridia bacterium]